MIDMIMTYLSDLPSYFYTSLGVMGFIILMSFIIGRRVQKLDVKAKPSLFMTFILSFVGLMNSFVKGYAGKRWQFLSPIALSMALYVFLSNISGLITLDTPTKYTAITFSMSIIAFLVVQLTGLVSQSWKHFLGIFKPMAVMAPLNIISEFTPILSMALRLFGNIASGALILTMIYNGLGAIGTGTGWLSLIVAPPLHLLFDVAFGLIQTLVIVLLTVIFASQKIDEADLEIE